MSNDQDKQAWHTLCAKNGQPDAGLIRNSSGLDVNQCHEARKTMRRAVNAVQAKLGSNEYDEITMRGLEHAGRVIADLSSAIDNLEARSDKTNSAPAMPSLRNAADFKRHYRVDNHFGNDEEVGLVPFIRGVAGLKTTTAVSNALSVGTDSSGGYSVPAATQAAILAAFAPASSLMQAGASIVPLEEGAKSVTLAAVSTLPTAAWRLESGNIATSDPAFRAIVIAPKSIAFMFKASRELIMDSPNLQDALYNVIGQSMAREIDRAGLLGTGTNPEPRGLINTSGIQAITNGANGASLATTKFANLFSAAQAILAADAPAPTAAIMSPRSLVGLGQLADSTGQPMRTPELLNGVKLISTSQISNSMTVGTSTDCTQVFMGDFTKMFFMFRENVSIQLLRELYASTGELAFVCHARVDVAVQYPAAFAAITGIRP